MRIWEYMSLMTTMTTTMTMSMSTTTLRLIYIAPWLSMSVNLMSFITKNLQQNAKPIFSLISVYNKKQLEHAMSLKDMVIADQRGRLELLECTSYNGILVWKISNIAKKRQDAKDGVQPSLYSPCFFTARYGYKMCARFVFHSWKMALSTLKSLFDKFPIC